MPIEFEIDSEVHAVVIRAIGPVDAADFRRAVDQVLVVPGFESGLDQILDLSAGTLELPTDISRVSCSP